MDHSVVIRKCLVSEVENAPTIGELLAEYGCESAIYGLPPPSAKMETYRQLELVGALHVIGAFIDDELIGLATVMLPVLPHYNVAVAVTESFFVLKAFRKTGAGLKLLAEVERYSRTYNSPGQLVNAPFGSDLAAVLPHIGYEQTGCVFFKRFNYA